MLKVSVQIVDQGSPCRLTLVRLMSASPEAQRPITYHLVWMPVLYVPCISTWIQVPAGVFAFHEAISSVASKPTRVTGEVQVAYSQLLVMPVCGSV